MLNNVISASISSKKSDLIGYETVEIVEQEIMVLAINLEQEIEHRLTQLMKNPLSGYGNIYKFKNQEIGLTSILRYPEERTVSTLIRMYDFCQRCLEGGKSIFFNITEGMPYWGGAEKNEEE